MFKNFSMLLTCELGYIFVRTLSSVLKH